MLDRAVHTNEQKALMAQFQETLDVAETEYNHATALEKVRSTKT